VPPEVVTLMSIVPADCAGELAVHDVVEAQLTEIALIEPNLAVVDPTMKPDPEMLTTVPAVSGPADGLTAVIAGTTL
jgi:hypothetical protein